MPAPAPALIVNPFSFYLFYLVLEENLIIFNFLLKFISEILFKLFSSSLNVHMVSLRQEQNPIMKFAVPFLKMFAFCMLWRAQFLSDFYSVFCVHQILISLPLSAKIWEQKVSSRVHAFTPRACTSLHGSL